MTDRNDDDDLGKPLRGHEHLTMGDQMRAVHVNPRTRTNPVTGAVENPRREFLKMRIASRVERIKS